MDELYRFRVGHARASTPFNNLTHLLGCKRESTVLLITVSGILHTPTRAMSYIYCIYLRSAGTPTGVVCVPVPRISDRWGGHQESECVLMGNQKGLSGWVRGTYHIYAHTVVHKNKMHTLVQLLCKCVHASAARQPVGSVCQPPWRSTSHCPAHMQLHMRTQLEPGFSLCVSVSVTASSAATKKYIFSTKR